TLVIPYTRLLTLLSKTKLLPLASHLYYLFLKVHESRIMLPSFGLLLLFVYSFFLYSGAINLPYNNGSLYEAYIRLLLNMEYPTQRSDLYFMLLQQVHTLTFYEYLV